MTRIPLVSFQERQIMIRTIRPQDVVAEYVGATTVQERREAHQLYQQTSTTMICFMAVEMGYTGFNVGPNSAFQDAWCAVIRSVRN